MTKITDMIGQEVQIGDRIAAAFRCSYGTTPELRVGTVEDIVFRVSSQRNGSSKVKEPHLQVRWGASSHYTEIKLGVEDMHRERELRAGKPITRPSMLDKDYKEKTSDILVGLRRFLKVG